MNLFKLSIITPDGVAYEGAAEYCVAPGVGGAFAIMAGHAPLVAATRAGVFKIVKQAEQLFFALGESLIEVSKEQTLVLASLAAAAPSEQEAERQSAAWQKNSFKGPRTEAPRDPEDGQA